MNKYVLSFFLLLATLSVWGQKKSKVNLVSSILVQKVAGPNGIRIIKVQKGVFRQDYSTLTSDSAYFYPDQNMVDAFGHVVINQGDTVHIYSDKLNYKGNTKVAVLTDHVIMVDKDATLTTNNFTYNTATRIGTYVDGGKLINKDNVLTSKNGYYFAFTRDAYFRYDVVCTTPDAVINTDTMRYNSGTRINYFYGPTIIKGKDKDNLYTENGTYNTVLKQAAFGKNNLYTSKTKSLKGDSLFYDRLKGYGRAVKHVVFTDTEQRITLFGNLGEYTKSNELTVITDDAYMIFITEDSTATAKPDDTGMQKADSAKATGKLKLIKLDSLTKLKAGKNPVVDSLIKQHGKVAADTISKVLKKANASLPGDKKLSLQGVKDSVTKQLMAGKNPDINKVKLPANANKMLKSANIKAPPAGKLAAAIKKAVPAPKFADKPIPTLGPIVYKYADTIKEKPKVNPRIRRDTLFMAGDTFKTRMITYKDFKLIKRRQFELAHPDTSVKKKNTVAKITTKEELAKLKKHIDAPPVYMVFDTTSSYNFAKEMQQLRTEVRPLNKPATKPATVTAAATNNIAAAQKGKTGAFKITTAADSAKLKHRADSLAAVAAAKELPDTTRLRIVSVYNNAKIFKSDLQAKADSMFYSSIDSTIRMYNKPMIWTQGSQLSGDTINLQMKNKKLDNLDMYPSAFIVNIEKKDSATFNQAGGKFMHGTFKNGKLNKFTIIGNAETIYFKRDTVKNVVTDMSRTQSGKAYFNFLNGEISQINFAEKYEAHGIAINKAKEEDKVLKGFIWKPKDRPASKEAILSHRSPRKPVRKPGARPGITKTGNAKASLANKNKKGGIINTATDTTHVKSAVDTSDVKSNQDSLTKTDSLHIKPVATKAITDTLSKKQAVSKSAPAKLGTNQSTPKLAAPKPDAARDTLHRTQALKPGRDSARRDTTPLKKPAVTKP